MSLPFTDVLVRDVGVDAALLVLDNDSGESVLVLRPAPAQTVDSAVRAIRAVAPDLTAGQASNLVSIYLPDAPRLAGTFVDGDGFTAPNGSLRDALRYEWPTFLLVLTVTLALLLAAAFYAINASVRVNVKVPYPQTGVGQHQ